MANWKTYEDDERIKRELISSSKSPFKSKAFDEILLEDTGSLDINIDIERISSSIEYVFKSNEIESYIKDEPEEHEVAIQYLAAKVFENRTNLAQLYISSSNNTNPIITGSLTSSGNISSSGDIIGNNIIGSIDGGKF
jgi:hypothetical protein